MKVKIDKNSLTRMLGQVQNIVEKRNTMPVLINVLFDAKSGALKLFATNLEVSLTDEIDAEVIQPGRVAVNAKSLFEIIKEMPEGQLQLERQENNWLKVSQKKSVFNIVGISPEEFPIFPEVTSKSPMELESAVMIDMIEKTIYSVSNDETRYHLNGVYFEQEKTDKGIVCRMVATDGHRLSRVDRVISGVKSALPAGVIIPRKGLNEVRKILEGGEDRFSLSVEGAQIVIKYGRTVLMIRLVEGKYPNYKQLIPQNLSEHVDVKRDALLASLRRVSLLSNQKSKGVTLKLSSGRLEISSNNPELGDAKEELDVNYKGKDLKIGFNARYILDVLNSIQDESVDLELRDQLSPGLVRPHEDKNYTCVVMPMRI